MDDEALLAALVENYKNTPGRAEFVEQSNSRQRLSPEEQWQDAIDRLNPNNPAAEHMRVNKEAYLKQFARMRPVVSIDDLAKHNADEMLPYLKEYRAEVGAKGEITDEQMLGAHRKRSSVLHDKFQTLLDKKLKTETNSRRSHILSALKSFTTATRESIGKFASGEVDAETHTKDIKRICRDNSNSMRDLMRETLSPKEFDELYRHVDEEE